MKPLGVHARSFGVEASNLTITLKLHLLILRATGQHHQRVTIEYPMPRRLSHTNT
jgi:hypothetical protein